MKSRTPVPRDQRPPLPDFAPVPRKSARHDGWTPARQRAFIEALADTGSVSRAAGQVNMASEGAYALRRQPGADEIPPRLGSRARLWRRADEGHRLRTRGRGHARPGHHQRQADRLAPHLQRPPADVLPPALRGGRERQAHHRQILQHQGHRRRRRERRAQRRRRKASPGQREETGADRPTTGKAVSIDVTDSLRDVPAASLPKPPPPPSAPPSLPKPRRRISPPRWARLPPPSTASRASRSTPAPRPRSG